MKIRIFITLMFFGFILSLLNGCGKQEEKGGHFPMGGGGGDMNYEQQALKMEQDDLAKLNQGKGLRDNSYAKSDHDSMKGQDFAKIHEGVIKDPNEIIAVVNGENILRLELDRVLKKVEDKVSSSRLFTVEKRILGDLITQLLLKQFINKEGIKISPDRIENEIKKFRENLKQNPKTQDKSLEQVLEEQGGSVEELRVALDISFSIDEYLDKTVPEDELKEYFNENTGSFNGETVTASHILLDTRNIKDEDKLNEIKEKAEKIKEELDNGADFAKLAEKNSDCPSAKNGGQLGAFGRGEMIKAFTDVAFATDVNSISEPVKTQFGYHIIKVTDKKEGNDVKYEEVKDNVKIAVHNEKTIELIEGLNKNAEIEILLKETSQLAGGHGGSYGASPHWNASGGASPHGNMSNTSSPHGKEGTSSEKKVEESFSLTN